MFGSMKKALVAGAVVAVGAFAAPAMASAGSWSTDGSTPFAGAAYAEGTLTLGLFAPGTPQTTCDVSATIDLDNGGTSPFDAAQGEVTSFDLNNCSTTAPGCTVTATADTSTPWAITTVGSQVTISGIEFTNHYAGANCQLDNQSLDAWGSLSTSLADGVLEFVGTTGLDTDFGPGHVTGLVEVLSEADDSAIGII